MLPLLIRPDNLVERPWGGDRLRSFKGLERESGPGDGPRIGEAFEIAAYPDDPEAAGHPSWVDLPEGSCRTLVSLLEEHGPEWLGEEVFAEHGAAFPILPKLLDIRELLSVQAHPLGHPELYLVLEAEEGATLRLGFSRDIDAEELESRLSRGLAAQRELLARVRWDSDLHGLQALLGPALASNHADLDSISRELSDWLSPEWRGVSSGDLLGVLHSTQRFALETLNPISVSPGDIVYNAQPNLVPTSAAVHALGNPESLGMLLLEVRRPGPTLRAWDHVRFPMREVDIRGTLEIVPMEATRADDFRVSRKGVKGDGDCYRSVSNEFFVVDHLRPTEGGMRFDSREIGVHSLHTICGAVELVSEQGQVIAVLTRGRSAFVPANSAPYSIRPLERPVEVVRISLPSTE